MKPGVLYISYDGMLEPLGQSQVLAYLERLTADYRIHLISFEKRGDWRNSALRERIGQRIEASGIEWHPLRYHKRPSAPATGFDIAVGSARAIAIARKHKLNIVHARSYVPGLMALAVKRTMGAQFLFDMRGFWADERVDGSLWQKDGALYRAAKRVERRLLLAADYVVTLTQASEKELRQWPYLKDRKPPISVIPTCADLDRFTIQGPLQRDPFVLGYVGSVGTWQALSTVIQLYEQVRRLRSDTRLLIVNRDEHSLVQNHLAGAGISTSDVDVIEADHDHVPRHISQMSVGLALYRPSYSRLACAPTKIAEYLGCGVPCVGTDVGDVRSILESHRVGVLLRGFSAGDLANGAAELLRLCEDDDLQRRCRRAASTEFSLDNGVQSYSRIYDELATL